MVRNLRTMQETEDHSQDPEDLLEFAQTHAHLLRPPKSSSLLFNSTNTTLPSVLGDSDSGQTFLRGPP